MGKLLETMIKALKITNNIDFNLDYEDIKNYIKNNSGFDDSPDSLWGIEPEKDYNQNPSLF